MKDLDDVSIDEIINNNIHVIVAVVSALGEGMLKQQRVVVSIVDVSLDNIHSRGRKIE